MLEALEAVRTLHAEGRELEFRMIGDDTLTEGGYAARVNAYIRDHGLERLRHPARLPQPRRVPRGDARADVFLHPSVVDSAGASEGGAPTTILEAQALGMPVVSTLHCDIPNVTVPGESAVLVAERDPEALADALRDLLDHPERGRRWAARGARTSRPTTTSRREVGALEDRYLALLAR